MEHIEKQQELEDFLTTTYQVGETSIETIEKINNLGSKYELTLNDLGVSYEEIKKTLASESPLDNLASNILGKLDSEVNNLDQFREDIENLIRQLKAMHEAQENIPNMPQTTEVEIPPKNLPMVEPPSARDFGEVKKGEVVHDVTHTEQKKAQPKPDVESEVKKEGVPLPDYRYPGGNDPYREIPQ